MDLTFEHFEHVTHSHLNPFVDSQSLRASHGVLDLTTGNNNLCKGIEVSLR